MLHYRKGWCGLFLIFKIRGTSWPAGVFPGLLSCGISITLTYWKDADETLWERSSDWLSHPYAFQLFAYLLGFLMVFRTNFAYQRYWEAMGALQAMAAKWLDGACMAVVFDAGGVNTTPLLRGMSDDESMEPHPSTSKKGGPTHSVYAADVCHLCSLLHALALMHLRGDTDLDNIGTARDSLGFYLDMQFSLSPEQRKLNGSASYLPEDVSPKSIVFPNYDEKFLRHVFSVQRLFVIGGLSKVEREALERDGKGRLRSSQSRVAIAESWFMRRLIARQKHEQGESASTSPPILSRLYQVISDGTLQFSNASKIAETPFPFPYHNLISIFLWSYTFLAPILINGILMEDGLRAVMSFTVVFVYHALHRVGDNLEDPYQPYDPNELPLPDLQISLNKRLLAFGVIPDVELTAYPEDSRETQQAQELRNVAVKQDGLAKEFVSLPPVRSPRLEASTAAPVLENGSPLLANAEVIGKIHPTTPERDRRDGSPASSALTDLLRQSPYAGPAKIPLDPLQERVVFDHDEAPTTPRARCDGDSISLCSCKCATK